MAGLSEEGKAQRRALAVAKLAKVLGKGTGRGIAATSLMGGSEDEREFLEAILEAGDLEVCKRMAKERLKELDDEATAMRRKMERIREKFQEEEEQMEVNRGGRMEAALRSMHQGTFDSLALRVEFWDESFEHGLAVLCNNASRINARIPDGEMQRGADQLSRAGFCAWNGVEWGDDVSLPSIVEAIQELKVKGWPACFVFAYQQPWTLIEKIFDVVTPVFGTDDIAIEPSVFAWHLDPPSGDISKAGNNGFHLPHRDFTHTETFASDGSLSALSVWIPLTDARIDNGCMYVLPKEFDRHHDAPSNPAHLRAAVDSQEEGGVVLSFPFQGMRPLEGPAGTLMAWHGNTIHWGSRCASDAPFPRASIACTFCRKRDKACLEGNVLLTRHEIKELDLRKRLGMVAHSIMMHKRWYPITESLVPSTFFDKI